MSEGDWSWPQTVVVVFAAHLAVGTSSLRQERLLLVGDFCSRSVFGICKH